MGGAEESKQEEPKVEQKAMDPMDALKEVLKTSLYHGGLARGLREVAKALDRKTAHLCVLSKSCDEKSYVKLVQALCKQNSIPLLEVENSKTLGQWVGLCSYDDEGEAQKVVSCSSAVIKAWGLETPALGVLQKYIKEQGA